ncbi:MAG TPA: DUF2784 domain-containing protein [Burkholderiales bacterium]|nr:DUF2784 domain-containing protein [Burkholderiales bacterium]
MRAGLADIVLVVHFAFVAFVVGGLASIWLGAAAGWRWVRNFWFRAAHLGAITFVAAEAILGIWCPLTVWEARLRGAAAEKSFLAQWIHRILYYDWPEWVFTFLHVGFALAVAATWWLVPPQSPRKK